MNSDTVRPQRALKIFIPELHFPPPDAPLPCVPRALPFSPHSRELQFPFDDADDFAPEPCAPYEPHEPAVHVPSAPQRYCPACQHWSAGPSTVSPQKYFPTSPTYTLAAPATPPAQHAPAKHAPAKHDLAAKYDPDPDLAVQLARAARVAAALDGEIQRLEAIVFRMQPEITRAAC
jgi:hypothetical protein